MNEVKAALRVGISDLNTVTSPQTIRTSGLGSCVGVVIYDQQKKIAGLAHVMLPNSQATMDVHINPYKYADTAIPILIERLYKLGARKFVLKAKIAGGAQMFQFATISEMMRIGERNIKAVKEALENLRIDIVAKDVGGSLGRTIEFDPSTGKLKIRTINKKEIYI